MLLRVELQEKLLQPPKLKMIIQKPVGDVTALQRTIVELEKDKTQYSQQLEQQCDVIDALKRDVASANAKLSDVTGTWWLILHVSSYFFLFFVVCLLFRLHSFSIRVLWTLNTEFIAHLRLDSRIAEYIIKVQ